MVIHFPKKFNPGDITSFSWISKDIYGQPCMILRESSFEEFKNQEGVTANRLPTENDFFYEVSTD